MVSAVNSAGYWANNPGAGGAWALQFGRTLPDVDDSTGTWLPPARVD